MHTHVARTTLDKLQAELDALMPPDDHTPGPLRSIPSDLVDLKVEYLGGRDVLAIAVHLDHDVGPAETGTRHIRVEEYGPDHRYFETEDGPALPPDTAGVIEDARRTWVLFYGQDGRPTVMWLYRSADGATIGDPIDFTPRDVPASDPVSESEFRDDPDPMVWAKAFASRFTVHPRVTHDDDPVGFDDVAGLMVGWFSNFASAWERRVREQVAAETGPARVVVIRRQDNGWDRFAFVDDDGRMVAEFTVEPRCVSLIHDRPMPPEWLGIA